VRPERVVFGAVLVLALAAVAAAFAPGQRDMGQVVAPPRDSNSPVVKAVSLVADYDIYRGPVIVQAAWSRKKELSIVFFAEESVSTVERHPRQPPWEIQVLFGENGLAPSPRGVARNIRKLADDGHGRERARVGKAVAIVVSSLDAEHPVDLPLIIDARADEQGYTGTIWSLPTTPGGFVGFGVSRDLRRYRVMPGR